MDLVIQAPSIDSETVGAIADLANAQGIEVLHEAANQAFRLMRVESDADVVDFCRGNRIDCAFVDGELSRRRVALVAMDMDSTLITIECIDEIADLLELKPQVAAITAAAMRGEIDFPESLTRRVALLERLPVASL